MIPSSFTKKVFIMRGLPGSGQYHREDGPAVEWSNGYKEWWLNDKQLSEAEFSARTKLSTSLEGKEVEIDGVRYVLRKL